MSQLPLSNELPLATMENMRRAEAGTVALDQKTENTFSASPNDYFWLGANDPLTNEDGEPLVLAVPISGFRPAHLESSEVASA